MRNDNCFDVATYQRFVAGQLPEAETDAVAGHLEGCGKCLQIVRKLPEDSFVSSLRGKGDWPGTVVDPGFVRSVVEHVLKQRRASVGLTPADASQELPGAVVISCPGCGKSLKVKDPATSKKVKCPGCGQVIEVPAARSALAAVSAADQRTIMPLPTDASGVRPQVADQPTVPPPARSDDGPDPSASQHTKGPSATEAPNPDEPEHDSSLTDFLAPPQADDELGRLGGFRIVKILGHGGMGVVFQGEDPRLGRKVAIKAMLPHLAGSKSSHERFLREAKAAAALEHPHIVAIFHVDVDRGAPYIVMPFLKGEPLDAALKRNGTLPIPEVVRIGREIAEGLATAHEHGLMHRDIKPANIWLETVAGGQWSVARKRSESPSVAADHWPLATAHVKILDFGLARAEGDGSRLTQSGAVIGTPAYMAPEQARGDKLDSRCDLWSLGVVLYQMCTGELPFKGNDTLSTLMALAMNDPAPPSDLNAAVPRELSDVVMKLLEKDRDRRIGTAGEVVEALAAIERALPRQSSPTVETQHGGGAKSVAEKSAPAKNAPPSKPKKQPPAPAKAPQATPASSGAKRKPLLLAAAGGLAAIIAVLGIVLYWPTPDGVIRIDIDSDDPGVEVVFDNGSAKIKGIDKLPIRLTPGKHGVVVKRGDFEFATDKFEMSKGDKIVLKIELLKGKMQFLRNGEKIGERDFPPQLAKNDPAKKGETPPTPELPNKKEDPLKEKTPTPSGPLTASIVQKFVGHTGMIPSVALSQDGKRVLTGSSDNSAILWDAVGGNKIQTFHGHTQAIWSVALSGDGKRVLTGSNDKTAILWDAVSGKSVQNFTGHTELVLGVALSEDGKRVLTGSSDKTAILWDAASGQKIQTFQRHTGQVLGVALSGDGNRVLTGSDDKTAILWDAASGQKIQTFEGHAQQVNCVALSRDGKLVLTGANDSTASLWDAASGKKIQTFQGHLQKVNSVALSGDSKFVLTGSFDKTAILWEAATAKKLHTFTGHTDRVMSVALSRNGDLILTGSGDKTAILWEVKAAPPPVTPPPPGPLTAAIVHKFQGHTERVRCVALSGDGKYALTGSEDKTAMLWDAASGNKLQTFVEHTSTVESVALSADGKLALTGSSDGTAMLWDAASGKKIQTFQGDTDRILAVALSADGKHVVTGGLGKTVILWDTATGKKVQTFQGHTAEVKSVAVSGDGKYVLTGSTDRIAILWDAASGAKIQTYMGHAYTGHVNGVALSADGKLVLTGSGDTKAILWEAASGKKIQTFQGDFGVNSVALSGDGKYVLTGHADMTAILWEAASAKKVLTFRGHTRAVLSVALSGEGTRALTASADTNTAILWEIKAAPPPPVTPLPSDPLTASQVQKFEGHTATIQSVALSGDGKLVLTGCDDRTAVLWDAASAKKIQTFGHVHPVKSVALSGDGKLILTGSNVQAFLWDAAGGKKIQTFDHGGTIFAVALSGNGQRVLTASEDKKAILWDAVSGQKIQTFEGHTSGITCAAMTPDGKYVVTGAWAPDKTAILWEAATGKKIQTFEGHQNNINSVALSEGGKFVLTGSNDLKAILWDAASGQKIQTFHEHTVAVSSVALSEGARHVLTGSWDKTAILWDAASGSKLHTFAGHTGPVVSVALSGDGRHVLTGSGDKTAILWEVKAAPPPVTPPPPSGPLTASIVQKFQGHTAGVTSVALSGDGKFAVTGSKDTTAIVWDAASGIKIRTLREHAGAIHGVAMSGDGKRVLTGSEDQTAILRDAATGKNLRIFKGHHGLVKCVALSDDGKWVVTGSGDTTAILWDAATGKPIQTFKGHSQVIHGVAVSDDGKRVLTGSRDGMAILWEAASGKPMRTFDLLLGGGSNIVQCVAMSGDGNHILTGTFDQGAFLWEAARGTKLQAFHGHRGYLWSVALSRDLQRAVTGSGDKTANLWDVASGRKLVSLAGHTAAVHSVALSRDGNRVLTGSADNTAILWEIKAAPPPVTSPPPPGPLTVSMVHKFEGHSGGVISVALSADDKHILTGSADRTAILWDAASGKKIQTFQGHTGQVNTVALSGDSKHVATGSMDKTAILWDAASGKKIQTFGHTGFVHSVALSGDGKRVLTGSEDKTAILWDAASGKKIQTFVGHTALVVSVALSGDEKQVLTGSGDKTAILWDAASGQKIQTFQGHSGLVYGAALSGDGKFVLTGSWDKTAILWDAASGKKIQTLQGHTRDVYGVALSGDGKFALTGSEDKTAILWEAATGKKIHTFQGHTGDLVRVVLSGDSKFVLTGAMDKTAILWEIKAAPTVTGNTFKNSLGMEFALVPKGKAWLGGGQGKVGDNEVEMPRDFYLGVFEVTQEDWEKVMGPGTVPSAFSRNGKRQGDVKLISDADLKRFPVEHVSWHECQEFIKRLNAAAKKNGEPDGWEYRLPREAEWEYACRGGPGQPREAYGFDFYLDVPTNTLTQDKANFDSNRTNTGRPCKVGSYPPNRLGLYDMHGNVEEWCDDVYVKGRAYRGGNWFGDVNRCRAATRIWSEESFRVVSLGFRLARVPSSEAKVADKSPPFEPLNLAEKEAKKLQEDWAAKLKLPVEATNKIGMKLMLIPPAGAALPEAYYLGKYEVTQGEFEKVMGYNPSSFGPTNTGVANTSEFPVEQVSWYDAVEYCNKLSEREGLKPYYELTVTKRGGKDAKHIDAADVTILGGSGYRLPTEAQWEHGCRAGTKTFYHFGDDSAVLADYAWWIGNGERRTHGVGERRPNAFGLHDMHGNVWEWCEDQKDLKGVPDRVLRGGSFENLVEHCRAAYRHGNAPWLRPASVGFRVARVPSSKAKGAEPAAVTVAMLQKFQGHPNAVYSVALSRDGKLALTNSRSDKTAILWDAASGNKLQSFAHGIVYSSATLSGDGKYVLVGDANASPATIWDAASGKKIQTLPVGSGSVALSANGKFALTGGTDYIFAANLCDAASGKKLQSFQGHSNNHLTSVALSGDGKLVLTGSNDKTAILWDAASGQKIHTLQGHTDRLLGVALSADGKYVLTGSSDKAAILWDAAGGKKLQTFQGHSSDIECVALSGDGKLALTGSRDKTAILWDAASGQKIHTFQGHAYYVLSVALSGDGQRALIGSSGPAILWEVKTAPPIVPQSSAEKEAKKLQEDTAAKLNLPVEATNKIGMKLRLIPPAGAALPQAYYLGKYEVTQGEWQQVMGYNPSHFSPETAKVADTSKFPVEHVSWFDCVEFCNKLSEREGLKPYYELTVTKRVGKDAKQIDAAEVKILGGSGYHIPTETQWEHGCRAGTKTFYHFGNFDADLPPYAWFNSNSQGQTHGVGEKKPNAFGLYDMYGNVWEWCEDEIDAKGIAPRVIRGGSWSNGAGDCRKANPRSSAPSVRPSNQGLRVARVASSEARAAVSPRDTQGLPLIAGLDFAREKKMGLPSSHVQ